MENYELETNFEKQKSSLDSFSKSSPSLGITNTAQRRYTAAFQALVKAGLRQQIKKKYRGT